MNILLLIPDLGIGGAQKQFIETALHLQKNRKLNLCLVSINSNNEYLLNNNKNINVIYLRKKSGKSSLILAFIKYLVLLYKFKPNIVHAWLGRAHRFSFLGKIFYRSKIIFGFRNTAIRDSLYIYKFDFYFWSKISTNLYVCNSKIQNDYLRDVYSIKQKNIFLPNGYNINTNKSFITYFNQNKTKVKVLLPSRICKQKNQLELLEYLASNFNLLKFFKFYVVGPIYDKKYHDKILELLQSNNVLSDSVSIINKNIDISHEFTNSDVVLLNSKFEGFSNVILEAWDHSKLLIVSKASDPNELIENNYNGYSFESYDHLSQILNSVLNLPKNDLKNLLINGKKSLSDFSFDKIANQYFEIYRKLLN